MAGAAVLVLVCMAAYIGCVAWAASRIADLSDTPPQTPPESPRTIPLSPIRVMALSELVSKSASHRLVIKGSRMSQELEQPQGTVKPKKGQYGAWLFDGKKFHAHVADGIRPFRIEARGRTWDQQGTSLDGVMIYVSKDAMQKRRDAESTTA